MALTIVELLEGGDVHDAPLVAASERSSDDRPLHYGHDRARASTICQRRREHPFPSQRTTRRDRTARDASGVLAGCNMVFNGAERLPVPGGTKHLSHEVERPWTMHCQTLHGHPG